jgi:hypothetical protein
MHQTTLFETHFRNIRKVVQKDIRSARTSVLAAVAWFTDDHIFQELVNAAGRGVRVELILMDDDINGGSGLHYPLLEAAGVALWFYPEGDATMHLKMCLVDDTIMHTGSYNWTRKAATRNKESLTRMQVNAQTAHDYIEEFEIIKASCRRKYEVRTQPAAQPGNSAAAVPPPPPAPSAPPVYSGPISLGLAGSVVSLRLRIQLLELEIACLETEKNSILSQVDGFERRLRQLLSDLLLRHLELQKRLAEIKAKLTGKKQDEQVYQERREHFEQFKGKLSEDIRNPVADIPADQEAEMKRMYKEAVLMAHPDLFHHDSAKEAEANKIMAELTEAFRKKDFQRVKELHEALKNGTAFSIDWKTNSDISQLQQLVEKLTLRRDTLLDEITQIQSSESWNTMHDNPDMEAYAESLRKQLEHNIQILENEIKQFGI